MQKRAARMSKYKMIKFDDVTKKKKKHNQNWPYIPDHLYRTLITGDYGSGKKKCIIKLNKLSTRY